MPNGCKHYAFTCNNYTEEDIDLLAKSYDTKPITYLVYGKEVGESGTPHLQGHVVFENRVSSERKAKKLLGIEAHIKPARNISNSIEYCKKDGNVTEFGVFANRPGKRSDLEPFKDAVKAGNRNFEDLRDQFSEVAARYPKFFESFIRDNVPLPKIEKHPLRDWQASLYNKLRHEPDRRKIFFVIDFTGNSGKSWFADYYRELHPKNSQVIEPGKKADMAYSLQEDIRVLFVDCPRSKQGDFIQYDFLESCKNGRVFSSKYESRIKQFNPMHVVVTMNEEPDMSKLSEDRYEIIRV